MPKLAKFPVEKLAPRTGQISGFLFENPHIKLPRTLFHSITIPVKDTALQLDFIELPGKPFRGYRALVGKKLAFPRNPKPGYIDASIYVRSAHNRMDVTRLEFVAASAKRVKVRLRAAIDFESEGTDFKNTAPFEIEAALRIDGIRIAEDIVSARRVASAAAVLAEFADPEILGKPVVNGTSVLVPIVDP